MYQAAILGRKLSVNNAASNVSFSNPLTLNLIISYYWHCITYYIVSFSFTVSLTTTFTMWSLRTITNYYTKWVFYCDVSVFILTRASLGGFSQNCWDRIILTKTYPPYAFWRRAKQNVVQPPSCTSLFAVLQGRRYLVLPIGPTFLIILSLTWKEGTFWEPSRACPHAQNLSVFQNFPTFLLFVVRQTCILFRLIVHTWYFAAQKGHPYICKFLWPCNSNAFPLDLKERGKLGTVVELVNVSMYLIPSAAA